MKKNQHHFVLFCLFCLFCILCSGCGYRLDGEGSGLQTYYRALEETETHRTDLQKAGPEAERRAIERFIDFYRDFNAVVIARDVQSLYAEEAYFRDPIREVRGIDSIETYFLHSTESFVSCTFDVVDVAHRDGNYYLRWIMHLTLKRDAADPIEASGLSHLRFNGTGKVIFHRDYWDLDIIYERLPFIGPLIVWVRGKM